MASPFSVFRKRQKLMMAILCLLAIVSFVFLPFLSDLIGGGGGGQGPSNPVAVKTSKYGDLKEWDLDRLRQNRQKILAVLEDLGQMAGGNPQLVQWRLQRMIGPATEESVVNSWLMAHRAEELGMVVGDEAINAFLKEWTNNSVVKTDFETAFKRPPTVSAEQFFDLMRHELLARQLWEAFEYSLRPVTPGQRWDYFNRVNCMATIEAIPVPVADFVKQVEEPTDEELKEFFEKHKDTILVPELPDPGFRLPQRVALEYLKAKVSDFTAPEAITDAEIKERYENNKESYDQLFKPPAEEKDVKEDASSTKDAKDTKEEAKETPKEEAKEPAKSDDAKGSSAVENPSPFRLASMLQEEKPKDKAAEEITETPEKVEKEDEKPDASSAKDAKEEVKEPPKEGMTDEMKDRIRQDIAYEKIQKIFERLREPMEKYRQKRNVYDAEAIRHKNSKSTKPLGPPPANLDFESMAKENGLTAVRTGLVSPWDLREKEIAASRVEGRILVLQYVFQSLSNFRAAVSTDAESVYLFWKTDEKKERTPKFEDEGVRDEVLRQWKLLGARSLALKQAEKWAEEARKADKPLKLAFADRPDVRVALPTKFSWMTLGSAGASMMPSAEISKVSGVEMAGSDFMKTVFRLQPNEVGVAFNAPQTVAYVVRPSEFSPPYDVRWKQFQTENFGRYAAAAQEDQNQIAQAWLGEIKAEAGFEWASGRKPDQNVEREE